MSRVKTFDSTGIAPNGRLYAGDMNAIQDQYADLVNLLQAFSVASVAIGESGLQIVRYGAGEARISGALRTDGILRALGGLYAGAFTTTARDAIASGFRPYGLVILNTTNNRLEWNAGTDPAPAWIGLGSGSVSRGTAASRPAASASNANAFYFATDTNGGTLYYSDGSVWTQVAPGLTQAASPGPNTVTSAMIVDGTIVDADISATAAIAKTKLASLAIVNADVAAGAAIAYAKLALTGSVVNGDLAGAIAASKISGYPGSAGVFLRGDGSWTAPSPAWTISASPPGSPADGDHWIYPADTTNGVFWEFVYQSAQPTYKWVCIGGSEITSPLVASFSITSGTPTDITGLTLTIPRAGDYDIRWTADNIFQGGFGTVITLLAGATTILTGSQGAGAAYARRAPGLAASTVVKGQINNTGTNHSDIANTQIYAKPVRVN